MAAPLRRSTRIDGSAGGEPLSCGNQSTYNRVANAGNLHRLSPFQMPFGILHNLTGKSSLTFSIEKCHFITAFPWGWMGAGVPRGLQNRLREAQNLPDEFDPHTPSPEKRESGGSAEPPLSCSFCCGKIRYLVENGRFMPQNVVIDTHGLTNGGE